MPAGGRQAENGLRNVEAQPQIAGVWYAEAESNGSSGGEIFFTGCKVNQWSMGQMVKFSLLLKGRHKSEQ